MRQSAEGIVNANVDHYIGVLLAFVTFNVGALFSMIIMTSHITGFNWAWTYQLCIMIGDVILLITGFIGTGNTITARSSSRICHVCSYHTLIGCTLVMSGSHICFAVLVYTSTDTYFWLQCFIVGETAILTFLYSKLLALIHAKLIQNQTQSRRGMAVSTRPVSSRPISLIRNSSSVSISNHRAQQQAGDHDGDHGRDISFSVSSTTTST